MNLTAETKIFGTMGIVTLILVIGSVLFFSQQEKNNSNTTQYSKEQLIGEHTFTRGNASASAYLVEFSDFQCPACKTFDTVVQQILANYPDTLLFAYRHYPLPQHPFAQSAAYAVEVARLQGKFWDMHTQLFENQDNLSDATLDSIITKLALDKEQFEKDKNSAAVRDIVLKDQADASKFRVNSTPTFFLNGVKLTLRSPLDLKKAVEEVLK